jgi:hypothetical protein
MSPFSTNNFQDLTYWEKMLLTAYNQVREYEEAEMQQLMLKAKGVL